MTDRVVLAPLNHIHHHHHHNSLHHHHHYTPHAHHHHHHHHHINSSGRKRKHVKRLSSTSQLLANTNATAYYPTAFITNPCDQLFGPPQPFDYDLDTSKTSQTDRSFINMSFTSDSLNTADNNTSINSMTSTTTTTTTAETSTTATVNEESNVVVDRENNEASGGDGDGGNENSERFEYIPTPKWTKIQNSILEELFKKSRYPKSNELKTLAQRFHVMDSDIEEWFRKRRGRDRKIKRKNEVLKNLIDSYIDK